MKSNDLEKSKKKKMVPQDILPVLFQGFDG